MDWLWPLYSEYVRRSLPETRRDDQALLRERFLAVLAESTATLFAMAPVGDTIRFKGLARWPIAEAAELLADPNGFISDRFGGGKFKLNFHHGPTFVATHNFRTFGAECWPDMDEVVFD
jgi:hypothetical protein